MNQLRTMFRDPQRQSAALARLKRIRQLESETTAEYVSNFDVVLVEAGQDQATDATKIAWLDRGLPRHVK